MVLLEKVGHSGPTLWFQIYPPLPVVLSLVGSRQGASAFTLATMSAACFAAMIDSGTK